MGSVNFMLVGYGTKANKVFDHLVSEAIYEYGNDNYNGTISTTNLVKTVVVAEKYSDASQQEGYACADKLLDQIGKRDCVAIDLGVTEYRVSKIKKVNHTQKPPVFRQRFVVIRDMYPSEKVLKDFGTKKQADDYAIEQENPELLVVCKRPVLISGSEEVTTFKKEEKVYKSKPKRIPVDSKLEEIHKYMFVGWAAE